MNPTYCLLCGERDPEPLAHGIGRCAERCRRCHEPVVPGERCSKCGTVEPAKNAAPA